MTARGPDATTSYELRVGGHLDQHWSTWFDGFTLTHEDDGTSTLRGVVRDQSELHGLLGKVRDLGVTLISVTPGNDAHSCGPGTDSPKQEHR
jgi:hypothetical protein